MAKVEQIRIKDWDNANQTGGLYCMADERQWQFLRMPAEYRNY
ncbi:hypothetical protein ACFL3G_06225 [Planctomycetota bacterium]